MKRFPYHFLLSAVLVSLLLSAAPTARAQAAAPAAAPQAPAASNFRAEALRLIADAETKLVRLAEAVPADKYTWRPGEGVRSISEVFMHVSAGNFSIPRRIGTPPPDGLDLAGLEKSTADKARVIQTLKDSFAHVRKAIEKLTDADTEKTSPWFGNRQATYREIAFFLATHEHEHLGQSIAYARMNGIVPPWTEDAQQRQRQRPPAKSQP